MATSKKSNSARKTYVIDTSVLLADPGAMSRFEEHEVIIPIAVIGELETKRDHPNSATLPAPPCAHLMIFGLNMAALIQL